MVNNKGNGAKEEGGEGEKRGDQRRPEGEKEIIIIKNFHFNFFFF